MDMNLMGIWKVNHKSLMTVTFNINDQIQQENLQEVIKIMFIDDKSATLITNHTSSASGDTLKSTFDYATSTTPTAVPVPTPTYSPSMSPLSLSPSHQHHRCRRPLLQNAKINEQLRTSQSSLPKCQVRKSFKAMIFLTIIRLICLYLD